MHMHGMLEQVCSMGHAPCILYYALQHHLTCMLPCKVTHCKHNCSDRCCKQFIGLEYILQMHGRALPCAP